MDIYFKEELIQRCKKIKGNTESLKAFMVRAVEGYVSNVEGCMEKNDRRSEK